MEYFPVSLHDYHPPPGRPPLPFHQDPAHPRIALATSVALTRSDRWLVEPLLAHGFIAEPAVWSDPSVVWSDYAAVVIRSCWNYHRRVKEFLGWIDRLEAAQIPVINCAGIVRWNSSKHYLLDLAKQGVPIPPTVVVARGALEGEIDRAVSVLAARNVVVKPAISASAYDTWRATLPLSVSDTARIQTMAMDRDVIVQSFIDTVIDSGELSLVFFDGVYSHAARKFPKAGDFRVQGEHGGRVEIEEATPNVIVQAERALRCAPAIPTYARVDGIVVDGVFVLMELEFIEPELYLYQVHSAAGRFAAAIAAEVPAR